MGQGTCSLRGYTSLLLADPRTAHSQEVADRLERVNQTLLQENSRLKSQFTSQEEDRNFLIKQLVAVKKDNARCATS